VALIGLTTILPIYVQGVLGRTPIEAGLTLTTLVFGWPLAVMLLGRLYRIFGIRSGELIGRLHTLLNEPNGLSELAGNTDIRMIFFHALYLSFWGVSLCRYTRGHQYLAHSKSGSE
jgi:hypothetical protein